VSVSPAGRICLHRVDPLSVRKQIEGQIAFGYSDALYQAVTIKDGRAVEGNFDAYPTSRMEDYPREVDIAFVKVTTR
jgi:CO/xanthine dehydrogenase Mo-binding subunit